MPLQIVEKSEKPVVGTNCPEGRELPAWIWAFMDKVRDLKYGHVDLYVKNGVPTKIDRFESENLS